MKCWEVVRSSAGTSCQISSPKSNEFNKNDYTQNNLYYNQDNSKYYISIDNSTDEYYLIDVQYSPTFVTVNYTYNTTNNYNE